MPSLPTISDFQSGVAIDRSHQRDEAVGGKIYVANPITRQAENVREDQVDGLAAREDVRQACAGQGGEQADLPSRPRLARGIGALP